MLSLTVTACGIVQAAGVRAIKMMTIVYYDGPNADSVKHRLDLYPPTSGSNWPVLLFFHGGVWQFGDKDQYRNVGEAFAARGILTAVVNYRLTPAVRHPSHVQDAARAVAWMVRNASSYGGRTDSIFLSGHSAGGHLISLLLFDQRYLRAEGVEPVLGGVIPLSGIFDLTRPIDDTAEGGFALFIHPPFGNDRKGLEVASPIRYLRPTRVPLLVILAGDDSKAMQRQSRMFVGALRRRNIPTTFEIVPRRGHFELVQAIGQTGDPTTELLAGFVHKRTSR